MRDLPPAAWRRNPKSLAVAGLWSMTLLVIIVRVCLKPDRNTVFTTFRAGGEAWMHGKALYENYRGFVYSPLAAALFAPFALLPVAVGNILWRLLNAAVYLGTIAWWLRAGVHQWVKPRLYWLAYLLLLPLSIGNLNNGQVNPLIIGVLMMAVLAAREERWTLAACCIAITAYFKIYPLALGLVLAVLYPRRFAWRLLAMLVALGLLPFALQRTGYVLEQYHLWFITRAGDNRQQYKLNIAPRDLWMLLHLVHVAISERLYVVIQMLSGAAVAAVCLVGQLRAWSLERLSIALLSLACVWMLLCGPATESATYILLAPAVTLALVQLFSQPASAAMRVGVTLSYSILLFALQLNSFFHLRKSVVSMSIQPVGALVFAVFALAWLLTPSYWTRRSPDRDKLSLKLSADT